MNNFFEESFNLLDIFKESPKEPFSINIAFNCDDIQDFFNNIKTLFINPFGI